MQHCAQVCVEGKILDQIISTTSLMLIIIRVCSLYFAHRRSDETCGSIIYWLVSSRASSRSRIDLRCTVLYVEFVITMLVLQISGFRFFDYVLLFLSSLERILEQLHEIFPPSHGDPQARSFTPFHVPPQHERGDLRNRSRGDGTMYS